jgi:hypothetical protein
MVVLKNKINEFLQFLRSQYYSTSTLEEKLVFSIGPM